MRFDQVKSFLEEANPDALLADGFEDACVGVVRHFNRFLAMYDTGRCIQVLVDRDGLSYSDASEFLEFNVLGAWMGQNTPVFTAYPDQMTFAIPPPRDEEEG